MPKNEFAELYIHYYYNAFAVNRLLIYKTDIIYISAEKKMIGKYRLLINLPIRINGIKL